MKGALVAVVGESREEYERTSLIGSQGVEATEREAVGEKKRFKL